MSNGISETIVTMIIDKLITKVFRDQIIKEIYSNFNNHCNNFISKLLLPYLNTSLFFHENGLDLKENNSNNNDILFHSIKPKKVNTWVSFIEPKSSIIDRYTKNKLSAIPDSKNEKIKSQSLENYDIVNEMKELEKEKQKTPIKTKKKKIKIELKDIFKKENFDKNSNNNNSKRNLINKKIEINNNKIYNDIKGENTSKNGKKEKENILEIQGTFIPYEKNEKINIILNNTEENDLLRKEREKEIIEKEEKIKNEKKRLKPKRSQLINKKINLDKLTFDSNGNIIRLRLPHVDSFNKEFIFNNPKIKEEINNELTIGKNDINLKMKNSKKISNKIIKLFNNKIKSSDKIKIFNKNSENTYTRNKEIKIEYNPEGQKEEYYIKSSKKINAPPLVYSGSNFEKISPEIGVVISYNDKIENNTKEKNNKKIGGFEYIKKYNRPSMYEISNLLLSQNSKNYNNQLTSFFNYDYSQNTKKENNLNSEINKFNTENNYIGYKEEFNDNNNPLFQGALKIKEDVVQNSNQSKVLPLKIINKKSFSNENIFIPKRKINSIMKKNISYHINPLYNKKNILINNKLSFQEKNITNKNNYLSSMNTILLSDNFNNQNLKSVFLDENENHINTQENKIKNQNKKNNLINYENNNGGNINLISPLKNLNYRKKVLPIITEINNKEKNEIKQKYINKFNLEIMKNKNWGSNNFNENFENKNSYKEQFIRQRNNFLTPNNIKISKNKDNKMKNYKIRNKSKLKSEFNTDKNS